MKAVVPVFDKDIRNRLPLPLGSLIGVIAALVAVGASAFFILQALQSRRFAVEGVTHALQVLQQLETLMSSMKDAETGQRGFLLTGEERYLEPYVAARTAVPGEVKALRTLLAGDPQQTQRLDTIDQLATEILAEVDSTIADRRDGPRTAAAVPLDRGKAAMDRVRTLVSELATCATNELRGWITEASGRRVRRARETFGSSRDACHYGAAR